MLDVGDKAPDFTLQSNNDKDVTLSSLAGKKVVLFFYPKDNTKGCTQEARDFTEHAKAFKRAGVTVLGISPDSVKSHKKFVEKQELEVNLLADDEKKVVEDYGVWVEKSMYGRKYMGVERSTFLIGPDGRIAQIWRKVKIPKHVEIVLDAAKNA